MKPRLKFSWFIQKFNKLRKLSSLLAKHSPPPSTSPPQAPADNQKTTETMPLHTGGTVLSPDEMSFDDLWDKAAKYFEDVCGKSLRDGNIRTFDDVEKQIEKQNQLYSDSDDKSKNRWEKTKGMGLETLKYLRALLGVASSASSVTPFPLAAEMTSRALDFVLSVPQQNHDYNEAVDKVFPHVSTALAEFKIYRKIDNKPLLPEIHHVLGCFVRLCALVVKHHQGGKRALIKGVLNRALRIDDELDQQLVEFNQAMQRDLLRHARISRRNVLRKLVNGYGNTATIPFGQEQIVRLKGQLCLTFFLSWVLSQRAKHAHVLRSSSIWNR
ncbi:hypothetical protein NXS19_008365 [Fusarium pseudograminearum]|nr:hypothetical protein NXS19_008365 [Fusarium pseudograminearum]